MNIQARALAAFLAVFLVSGVAWAERDYLRDNDPMMTTTFEKRTPVRLSFNTLDTNGDGRISAAEAGSHPLGDAFWVLDRNLDGLLTPQEFRYRPN